MFLGASEMYTCPVCGYPQLPAQPANYEICPSCGTEFDYHDANKSHSELRAAWISQGASWHSKVVAAPRGWNATQQLIQAGFASDVPQWDVKAKQ